MRDFAGRLMAHESGARSANQRAVAAFAIPDRMRPYLVMLMGNGGHHALLMRALTIAGSEVPWLRACRVGVDGNLKGPDPSERAIDPDEMIEGGVVLVAQLIGLLVAFIGERLTLQLVREVWPKLPAKNLNFKN